MDHFKRNFAIHHLKCKIFFKKKKKHQEYTKVNGNLASIFHKSHSHNDGAWD